MNAPNARRATLPLVLLSLALLACSSPVDGGVPRQTTAQAAAGFADTGIGGLFRAAPDRVIAISERPPGGVLTDFGTGMIRGLAPDGPDTYLVGAGLRPGPAQYRLTFARDASAAVVSFAMEPVADADAIAPVVATRCCPHVGEEFRFESEGLQLAGYRPPTGSG